jgi:zinc protease
MSRARAIPLLFAAGLVLAVLVAPSRTHAAAPDAAAGAPLAGNPLARTLANGLRVVVFPRPGVHVVQLQLQVAAGLRQEAAGQDGLAYLTAQMLRQGTTSRSLADFETELDTLGATFAASVNRDAAQVAAGCRAAEFESVLEIMSDAVINPLFADESFQTLRRQVAGQLGVQAQNPVQLADERAAGLAFGAHPYGHATRGSLAELLGASRDQARVFHRDHWRPDVSVLAIAGDIDPQRAFAAATEWFGRWTGKAIPEPSLAAPAAPKGTWVYDLPGSPVTEVRALVLGPGRGAPSYAGWAVLREVLEGGALPSGAHAVLSAGRDASLLMVSATARPESTAAVAARVREALRAAVSSPPAPEALAAARKRVAQGWAFTVESLGQLLSSWLAGDAAGLPPDHLVGAAAALRAGTPTSSATAPALLLAGPTARMKDLSRLGRVDTLRTGAEAPAAVRAAAFTPEQRKRGRQLVDAAVVAHGGAVKLKAIRGSEMNGDVTMSIGGRELTGETRFLRLDPERLAYTTRFLEFEHRQVLDGSRGWALSTAGDSATLVPSDSTSLLALRAILEADLAHLLRAASDPASDVAFAGRADVDSKPCDLVEFTARANGRVRLSLDATTHRVTAVELQPTPQGQWRDRRRWSEFIQVEGVWWPRREARELDGETVSNTTLRALVVNGPVDSMLFKRPLVTKGRIIGVE